MDACKCKERKKPIENREWFVIDRNCNYSAFNGYRWTLATIQACNAGSAGGYGERKRNLSKNYKI